MPLEGMQIGRYRFIRMLGSGGMGEVYLAEDARIGQQVAIKVIRAEASPYPDDRATKEASLLFEREAIAVAKLDHPHILPLFDYGEAIINKTTLTYLVMPFRQEGSLVDWLRRRSTFGLLSPQDVAYIVDQTANALQHAHDHQIIHQDVKPSNLLIRERKEAPNRPDVLLADFGIAKSTTATASTSQVIRGTPTYMAPEQWEAHPVTATDQYALAVMTYELLTGRPPFQGGSVQMMYQHFNVQPQPPSTFNARLSTDVDTVLLKAMAKKPTDRFASISAFANALQQAAQSLAVSTFEKPMNIPGEGDIHVPITISEAQALETKAPTVTNTSPQPLASITDSNIIPFSHISMTPANTFPEEGGSTQHNTVNTSLAQQNTINVAQGKTTHILKEDEIRDHLPAETITPPLQESGTVAPRRRMKRRPLLVIALVLLTVLLAVFGGVAYAEPGVYGSLVKNVSGIFTNAPLTVSSATVTITPASIDLKKTYIIPAVIGTPDVSKHQVQARSLSVSTQPQSKTVKATGTGTTTGTHATGILTIESFSGAQTFNTGMVLKNEEGASTLSMMLDATVTVASSGTATVPAHVVQVGTKGNIASESWCAPVCGASPGGSWRAYNTSPFSGGQDPQPYTAVQQSDIDDAVSALETNNTPNAQQVLQEQVHANEHFVGTPTCNPNVTKDHAAGDEANSVMVMVTFTCTGEVYDQQGALAMAKQWLKQDGAKNPGASYALVGNVVATQIGAQISDANQGIISVSVAAEGVWVYKFSDAQEQVLAKLIAGKKKATAQSLLSQQPGVMQTNLQLTGGDGDTLPTNFHQIKFVVLSVKGK